MPGRIFTLSDFALAGLAAPPGILGPQGAKRGARDDSSRPAYFSMLIQKKRLRGPKTQSGPGAKRRNRQAHPQGARSPLKGGPCNTPLHNYLGVIRSS